MDEVFKRILDKLTGADFWIGLGFLAVGITVWLLIGTTKKHEQKVLRRQIFGALLIALLAACGLASNHLYFIREPVFSTNFTGILVMRIAGDDALDSLQGDLIEHLNADLQKEPTGAQIEVHAGTEAVDENQGLADAHRRARAAGQHVHAQLVIWGRKIGEKQFFPRITIVSAAKGWGAASERTRGAQDIAELRLPAEVTDEPFYLIHFATGFSFYDRENYKEALPHFEAALQRKGALTNELADLQFFTAYCHQKLCAGQTTMSADLQRAITLYESSAEASAKTDQERWALTQNNLGNAYSELPTGDHAANLQMAIAADEAALRVFNENDFPVYWALTENNLGNAYSELPTGNRATNLQMAIAAYEAALRVSTEKNFPADWARTENNLGAAYHNLSTGDRAANLQMAIAAYEAALRVSTEKDFPDDWARTENNLGAAYRNLPTGDRAANLKMAIAAYEAALRVRTEKNFPIDWAITQSNLGNAYALLRTGDRAANLQTALAAYEAALRIFTEKNFPFYWAMTQNNLAILYGDLSMGGPTGNPQKAIAACTAALRVFTENDFPAAWAETQDALGTAFRNLPTADRAGNLQNAVAAYAAALRVRTERDSPFDWSKTQYNLGILYSKQTIGNRLEDLPKAKACFEAALRIWSEDGFPDDHRDAAAALSDVEQNLRSLKTK